MGTDYENVVAAINDVVEGPIAPRVDTSFGPGMMHIEIAEFRRESDARGVARRQAKCSASLGLGQALRIFRQGHWLLRPRLAKQGVYSVVFQPDVIVIIQIIHTDY